MTRKHFEAIAADFREQVADADLVGRGPFEPGQDRIRTLNRLAVELSHTFKTFNPNFDQTRFLTACGF